MPLAFSTSVVVQISDFEHAVAQIPDVTLLNADGLVLRVNAQLWLAMDSEYAEMDKALQAQVIAVSARAPGINVYVLPDGHSAAEARPPYVARHGPRLLIDGARAKAIFEPVSEDRAAEIREQDLSRGIAQTRSRCVVCSSSHHHFELPSGAHASQFVRLAEAFVDIEAVDRVAYWVALDIQRKLPPLTENRPYALLVDHPSMLIVAARVQKLVSIPIEIVAFSTYPSDIETRTASFELLRRVAVRCSTLFVLIGVASTGRLALFIRRWADATTVDLHVTVLYAVERISGVDTLCHVDLPNYKHYVSAEHCTLCAGGSAPVRIHASTYMLSTDPATSVALPPPFFEQQRAFIERWGGSPGVLRVHYNDPNESTARHHAFYVDAGSLLNLEEFKQEVLAHLSSLSPKPHVVAIPSHPTAHRLGTIAANALSVPLAVLTAEMLTKGIGDADGNLYQAECVLVVDDVFITGSRIDSINRFFRERKRDRAPALVDLHYFTLLATPASEEAYEQSRRGKVGNHGWTATLTHLYKFVLPDWHSIDHCPWCREHTILSSLAQSAGDVDGPLIERLAQLSNVAQGLTDEAYFASEDAPLPTLGSNSLVLPEGATPIQVLFACASAVQQLRHAPKGPLNADQFPAPSYLAERVFSKNFTERLIWLGLLRSLKGRETETKLRQYLVTSALSAEEGNLHLRRELAVAWICGKLGALDESLAARQLFADVGITWDALFEGGLVDS